MYTHKSFFFFKKINMRETKLLNEFKKKKKKRVRKQYVKNAKEIKRHGSRLVTFLVVQWLRLHALKAGN